MKRPCAPPTVMAAVAAPLGLAGRGSGIPLPGPSRSQIPHAHSRDDDRSRAGHLAGPVFGWVPRRRLGHADRPRVRSDRPRSPVVWPTSIKCPSGSRT